MISWGTKVPDDGYSGVMDFKATASRGVLIAQFEEYFDDALQKHPYLISMH